MKKCLCFILLMFLLMALTSCTAEEPPEVRSISTEIGGQAAVVTLEEGTWSSGTVQTDAGIYRFAWDRSGDLNITYPDGSECTYRTGDGWGTLASSPEFDPDAKGYISGMTMAWGIESAIDRMQPERNGDGGNVLLGIFLLALGAWNAFAPRTAWYLAYGWRFRNAEPSEAALAVQAIGGVILLLVGGVCLLAAIF